MTLEEWMTANDVNDAALAARLGNVSRSQINRIRRRECRPRPNIARELERITGIPAGALVMGDA